MAATTVFAPRYANALASVLASHGLDAAAAQGQLKQFAEVLSSSAELREVLTDPSIPSDQKIAVIDGLAERLGMMREARNFIAVIVDHQRLGELNEILAAYDQVADTNSGVTEAEVSSSRELDEDDRRELETRIATLAGTAVRIRYSLDPSLLGGAVVRIGATVYDGSVKTQLQQMKEALIGA